MAAYERDVLRADAREVELTRHESRELDHRLVHDDDDQALDIGSAAQIRWKVGVAREDPTPIRFVRDEAKRSVPHRMLIPERLPQPGVRHAVQQMGRKNGQVGKYKRKIAWRVWVRRSGRKVQLDCGIVDRDDARHGVELILTGIAR